MTMSQDAEDEEDKEDEGDELKVSDEALLAALVRTMSKKQALYDPVTGFVY